MNQARLFPREPLRRCVRCLVDKAPKDFAWRDKARGKRFAHCRACQAEYHRKHYAQNRQHYLAKAAIARDRLREENQALLLEFLETHPCVECGERDPVVLEFDHLADKKFGVARAIRYMTWRSVLVEISKCEVVCGNRHRRRTATRQASIRLVLAMNMQEISERVKRIELS